MLKPQLQITHDRLRFRPIGQTSIATFERLHKALGHAVALQAFYLCSEEFESQLLCTDYRFNGGINCAALPAAKRYSIACIIKSLPGPEAIPLVVATQLMTLRALQSRAKATRTFSPLSQDSSKPSEQQRIIVAHQAANGFVVHHSWAAVDTLKLQRRPHTAIVVGGQVFGKGDDVTQQLVVPGRLGRVRISPSAFTVTDCRIIITVLAPSSSCISFQN